MLPWLFYFHEDTGFHRPLSGKKNLSSTLAQLIKYEHGYIYTVELVRCPVPSPETDHAEDLWSWWSKTAQETLTLLSSPGNYWVCFYIFLPGKSVTETACRSDRSSVTDRSVARHRCWAPVLDPVPLLPGRSSCCGGMVERRRRRWLPEGICCCSLEPRRWHADWFFIFFPGVTWVIRNIFTAFCVLFEAVKSSRDVMHLHQTQVT